MATSAELLLHYPFASHVERGWGLRLAAAGTRENDKAHPHFFEGTLPEPRAVADMLLALSQVARSRFFLPAAARDFDPVVTSNGDALRFEAFSSCCSAYARLDLGGAAIADGCRASGTTNVDFNPTMRRALIAVRANEQVSLSVGREHVELSRAGSSVVEKKVPLSRRWLRGFCEVQAYQQRLVRKLELTGGDVMRFVRQLSAKQPRRPGSLEFIGSALRLTYPAKGSGISIGGAGRLKALLGFVSPSHRAAIYQDSDSGVVAWEIMSQAASFWLVLSPDESRGFSGEGQLLEVLARRDWRAVLARVQAALVWQSSIDSGKLARELGIEPSQLESALGALAARGLVGSDARRGAYFHRELPFDAERVDQLQPRLRGAKQLAARVVAHGDNEYRVPGTDVTHHVRLTPTGDRCTCRWFAKHQGARGPCRHVLAAYLSKSG